MESVTALKRRGGRGRIFRKQLVLPAEHGSWAWLLVPFLVGTAVAGRWNLAVSLVLVGGLAAFLVRQPATIWRRARQGRARRADRPVAAGWTLGLGLIALLCLAFLLALGHIGLLWLLVPLAAIFLVYLTAALSRRASIRSTWMEVAGAAALTAMAPATAVAVTGRIDSPGWILWILMALQNGLGALFAAAARCRHARPAREALASFLGTRGGRSGHASGCCACCPTLAGSSAIPRLSAACRLGGS